MSTTMFCPLCGMSHDRAQDCDPDQREAYLVGVFALLDSDAADDAERAALGRYKAGR